MNNIKRFIVFALIVSIGMMYYSPLSVSANVTKKNVQALVEEHVNEMINLIPDVIWSQDTTISDMLTTYGSDDKVNGYIVKLTTEGVPTGYIQIGNSDKNLHIISFALEGEHECNKIKRGKVYYLGNLTFAYESVEGKYKIVNNEKDEFSFEDLKAIAISPSSKVAQSIQPFNAHTIVTGFSSVYMVATSDFPGYTDHCSPTAGTNLIKYWGACRGMSNLLKNGSVNMSNADIFARLHTLMKTGNPGGTDRNNIIPGIRKYMNEKSIYPTTAYTSYGNLLFVAYIETINRGEPLIFSLNTSATHPYGNHSIFAVGYVGTYAIIIDGWNKSTVYYNYSDLNIAAYHHIAFN